MNIKILLMLCVSAMYIWSTYEYKKPSLAGSAQPQKISLYLWSITCVIGPITYWFNNSDTIVIRFVTIVPLIILSYITLDMVNKLREKGAFLTNKHDKNIFKILFISSFILLLIFGPKIIHVFAQLLSTVSYFILIYRIPSYSIQTNEPLKSWVLYSIASLCGIFMVSYGNIESSILAHKHLLSLFMEPSYEQIIRLDDFEIFWDLLHYWRASSFCIVICLLILFFQRIPKEIPS